MSSEPVRPRVGPDPPAATPTVAHGDDKWHHEDPTTLLEALGDEYTRAAFKAVLDRARSGREVAAVTDMSPPTAFRRLNVLVDLGLLETELRIDADGGHHHKVYRAVVGSFSVSIEEGEVDVVIEPDLPVGPRFEQPAAAPADD
ncbi:winged helix-turn-helix domain-containing protein [Halorhabdus rudnickae]|uniref:winged helix-turn-helix domain-containing protein n=1 Tax=Halorhabdus rudnickae TaxID=1775544 RepID=UPI001082C97F|nr:winged helix-turn-helix domain-containing protein [Halorhabdus rudnickae]